MGLQIVSLDQVAPEAIKAFTDQEIGRDYYSVTEIKEMVRRSQAQGLCASLALLDGERVVGVRISFPPGQWQKGKGQSLSPQFWPHPKDATAYFQSLFIARSQQRKGWGKKLSRASLDILKKLGAQGVVCHSWVESPGSASQKYLQSLQFKALCQYPNYWKEVDYVCPRCGKPCLCTAEEMYLDLGE